MSNAETLQRNNTRISENNTDLSSILETVNNLPKAGAGFEINDCSYLFCNGARLNQIDDILSLCKDVTTTTYMFQSCIQMKELDLRKLDTSKVTNMSSMFYYCQNLSDLKIDNFDTSQVTNMSSMFYYCNSGLQTLDLSNFNTSKVTNMGNMFGACKLLKNLNVSSFDTSNVTGVAQMFQGCKALVDLDLSHFDFGKVNSVITMFGSCTNLTNLTFMNNLGKGYTKTTENYSNYKLDLSDCNKLTYESLMNVINNLYDLNLTYDVANGGTLYRQQLVLGSTNLAKLTEEEIAIATNKGWDVS